MKVLSIDVGMKNLAYCLFNIQDNLEYNIEKWDVIDLCRETIHMCGEKNKNGKHDGLLGFINLVKDLKKYNFDKIFIFNSSLRFNLIAKLSKIKNIYQKNFEALLNKLK